MVTVTAWGVVPKNTYGFLSTSVDVLVDDMVSEALELIPCHVQHVFSERVGSINSHGRFPMVGMGNSTL